MSDAGESNSPRTRASDSVAAAIRRAEIALENVKRAMREGDLADVAGKAAAAASTLISEGEALIAQSEALTGARAELTGAVKRNPLAAIGMAFGAGVLIALLTRG